MVRAKALVGFYRDGKVVQPETVLELPDQEFAELRMFNRVEVFVPPPPVEPRARSK